MVKTLSFQESFLGSIPSLNLRALNYIGPWRNGSISGWSEFKSLGAYQIYIWYSSEVITQGAATAQSLV